MNISNKAKGFVCGAVAAATYGMNPLFTLPLYKEGLSVDSVCICCAYFRYSDENTRAVVCSEKERSTSATGRRIAFFRLFTTFIHEL